MGTQTIPQKEVQPNLKDYQKAVSQFNWEAIKQELDGLPEGKMNMAYEAIDRHAFNNKGNKSAIRWLNKNGRNEEFTYEQLRLATNKMANVLRDLGIGKGDKVYSLLGRVPELYFTVFGTLKNASVFCPLYSAFGPTPIWQRMSKGEGKVLVTTEKLYHKKVTEVEDDLPDLQYVLLIDVDEDESDKVLSFPKAMKAASEEFTIVPTEPEDISLLHFTSGTTGMPKGAIHVHNAVLMHYMTGKYVLDFHEGDVFWCTADPGWVTGTSYGIIAPLVHGITNLVDEADFDATRWYENLQNHRVNVWYTAPTAIRMLKQGEQHPAEQYDLSQLRSIHSVGEPLSAESVEWGRKAFGLPILDNWWQTETGGIMIANFRSMEVKPGSMGRPLPGIEATLMQQKADGSYEEVNDSYQKGELAIKKGWPSMFRGYLYEEEKYKNSFTGDWYLTEDLAQFDDDGYFWFVGRADDIIKTSGHMVGPFEVESTLVEHPDVAESAVIGKPHEMTGQLVKAFVKLVPGKEGNEDLKLDIMGHARKKLGSAVAPKELEFVENLPKTKSGKIMRRLLKARETGEEVGDTSTLEEY